MKIKLLILILLTVFIIGCKNYPVNINEHFSQIITNCEIETITTDSKCLSEICENYMNTTQTRCYGERYEILKDKKTLISNVNPPDTYTNYFDDNCTVKLIERKNRTFIITEISDSKIKAKGEINVEINSTNCKSRNFSQVILREIFITFEKQ